MRSVRSAICTSGEPVSPSWVRNCSIRLFFRSTASGIEGPPIATPQGAVLPRRGGFQKLFFCQQIRSEVTTATNRSKADGSGGGPCRGDVEGDLVAQRVDVRELPLFTKATNEGQGHPLVIEIAREIEDMSLHGELVLAEGRREPDVDDGLMLASRGSQAADVDADRKPQGPIRLDVGGRKAEGSAASGSSDHLAADRVGPPEHSRRPRQISPLKRRADLGRRDRDAVDHEGLDHVSAKSERTGESLEQPGIAVGATAEPVIEPDDDLPRLEPADQD